MENFKVNNNGYLVELISKAGSTVALRINGREYVWTLLRHGDETFRFHSDDKAYIAHVTEMAGGYNVICNGELFIIGDGENHRRSGRKAGSETGQIQIRSPIPGLVTKIYLAEGDKVRSGGAILTLDAMKMQNEIQSPCDGVIAKIYVKQGAHIDSNTVMALITRQ